MPFQPADRLKALPPYLFVEIARRKQAAIAAGVDVIDFGVGDPDQPTHEFIVARMRSEVQNPAFHRYPDGRGSAEFRSEVARFFELRYGVKLDPARELIALIGSKEGIGHLPLAVVNPGESVLIPEPGYPVYRSGTIFAGGVPETMTLTERRRWLPDLSAIPAATARRCRLMFLNYPNNPTGAVADRSFFEDAVRFARDFDLVIAHDAAYSEMYFDAPVPSILEVVGAKEVAIELHSLSKTFNMTGWRAGFAVGNPDVLAALAQIKDNFDSGVFGAVQATAIEAYRGIGRREIIASREMYQERAEVMTAGLRAIGFRVAAPRATFYLWAGVPEAFQSDSMGLARRLLDEAAVVCVPGIGFGTAGEGYVRFALTVDVQRIREALARLRRIQL